jgi:hypothetical protein
MIAEDFFQNKIDQRHGGIGTWLMDTTPFRTWMEEGLPVLLWVTGIRKLSNRSLNLLTKTSDKATILKLGGANRSYGQYIVQSVCEHKVQLRVREI